MVKRLDGLDVTGDSGTADPDSAFMSCQAYEACAMVPVL